MPFKTMLDSRKDMLISLFLFSLAFITRFLLISKGPFHTDTLELAINAQKTIDTLSLHYQHGPGYPLTVIGASIFIFLMKWIGINDPIFSVNFMSVIFGSLDIGIFYLFSRKILDMSGSLIASLIFAFLPLHLSVSTFGMTHPLSIFFNLAGLYLLFLYFEKYKLNKLILSAIFLGLGATARLTDGLIVVAVIFLYLIWSFRKSNISKKIIMYRFMLFLISYSIIILFLYLPLILKSGLSQFKDTTSTYYYRHSLSYLGVSLKWLIEILSLRGVVILIGGVGYLFIEKNRILFYFLIIWFFSFFVYHGNLSINCHRYLLFSLMPLLIMQGYFISKAFKRIPFLFSFFIFLFIVDNFIAFYPVIKFRHDYNLQEYFGEFVQSKTDPASYIIAIDEGPFIEYYAKRKILYKAIGLNKKDFEEFFKEVDILLQNGIPIFIVGSCIHAYDPKKYFRQTLFDNYYLRYIGSHFYENWNFALINTGLFKQKLYKIEKRS